MLRSPYRYLKRNSLLLQLRLMVKEKQTMHWQIAARVHHKTNRAVIPLADPLTIVMTMTAFPCVYSNSRVALHAAGRRLQAAVRRAQ